MASPAKPDKERLDRIVAEARRRRDERESGYRARALQVLPWVCTRCARSFDRSDVQLLTVHHKDHNHENNPPDGSNWELLCVYCHENEHRRFLDSAGRREARGATPPSTYRPFSELQALLGRKS